MSRGTFILILVVAFVCYLLFSPTGNQLVSQVVNIGGTSTHSVTVVTPDVNVHLPTIGWKQVIAFLVIAIPIYAAMNLKKN